MSTRTRTPNPSLFRLIAARGRRIAVAGTLAVFGVAAAGTVIAAPAPIAAQLEPRMVGGVHWTATSGNTNSSSIVLQPSRDASLNAARQFEWSERSDSPCWAALSFSYLNSDGAGVLPLRAELSRCERHRASIKTVSRHAVNEVITGIEVCLTNKSSSSKNRLKGVRLWGRTVDPETGALGPINGPSHAQRKHCSKWSGRVNCPAGQVAAKFKVFGVSDSGGRHMQGISLGCRAVEMRPVMRSTSVLPGG